jgi:hypothetical protein
MKYRIGYIDEEQTQVKKYQRKLRAYFDVSGYDITKGMELVELLKMIYDSEIDLLLVDYLLKEKGVLTFNGDEIIRAYENIRPRFPVLIFTNREAQAFPHVDNPNIIIEKDLAQDNVKKFVDIVKKNIKIYKNYIQVRKDNINRLLELGEKKGLNATEKNLLLENQLELKNLDKLSMEVPYQLLNDNKVEALSKTRKDAEKYLNSLIKKNKK